MQDHINSEKKIFYSDIWKICLLENYIKKNLSYETKQNKKEAEKKSV